MHGIGEALLDICIVPIRLYVLSKSWRRNAGAEMGMDAMYFIFYHFSTLIFSRAISAWGKFVFARRQGCRRFR